MVWFYRSGVVWVTEIRRLPSGLAGIPGSFWSPVDPDKGLYISDDWTEARALWRSGANAIYDPDGPAHLPKQRH